MMKVQKAVLGAVGAVVVSMLLSGVAAAHVVVSPAEVQTAAFQTFSVGVPNERDTAVTKLELKVPGDLQFVSPTVHLGWEISIKKSGNGKDAAVTDITWSGGSIPISQRDDFTFSAKVPAKAAELQWKAFQTYEDGTVVSWDQKPSSKDEEGGASGPYSVTDVVSQTEAAASVAQAQKDAAAAKTDAKHTKTIAYAGVALALVGIFLATRKSARLKV
jgi:uncharacterized protein YcnI